MFRIIVDEKQSYMDDILEHLRAYNRSKTGIRKEMNQSFYIVENDKLMI